MFSNYFKIVVRSLWRNKLTSGINILGLAIGIACTTLIALWIKRELSVNDFHEHKAEIYRILEHQTYGDDIFTFSATPGPLAEHLRTTFPEITHTCRSTWNNRQLITYKNQSLYHQGPYVGEDFLKIFSFPLLKGNPETVLSQPTNIVITEELADKYFLGEDPMGKTLQIGEDESYTVSGVLASIPENSSLNFDYLLPMEQYVKKNEWLSGWFNNGVKLYVRTQKGVVGSDLTEKIKNELKEKGVNNIELHAHALSNWYLRWEFEDGKWTGGGHIEYVRIFGIIAFFILLIACINFMNLTTAKSAKRALEVGIRKVTGATKGRLASQFLSESVIMAFIAGSIGIFIASIVLPFFNELFDLKLSMSGLGVKFWIGILVSIIITGLIAGSYPALFLSGFQPGLVLKGIQHLKVGGVGGLRKFLVTTQFVISIFLIVATLVIYSQMQMIKNKHLGYDKENLMYVPVNGTLWDKYEIVKSELEQLPEVKHVSATTNHIHSWGNNTGNVNWEGRDPEQSILFQTVNAEYDFLATIGAELLKGRDFSREHPTDSVNYIINETAAKLMDMEQPVGQQMELWNTPGQIIGLVKDFHVGSFRSEQSPVIMLLRPWKNFIYLKLQPQDKMQETLSSIQGIIQKHNPNYPFEYHFTDKEYEELHQSESRTGEIAKVFAFLAILISCMGLFGLAAFTTEQRRKEIGIRKVLGASITNIVGLLSKDFMTLVGIALVISTPLAYYIMEEWLTDFAFRIEIGWELFAIAGGLTLLVTIITVSFQSIKAAVMDPSHSLRSE